jgi:hypothetical protein
MTESNIKDTQENNKVTYQDIVDFIDETTELYKTEDLDSIDDNVFFEKIEKMITEAKLELTQEYNINTRILAFIDLATNFIKKQNAGILKEINTQKKHLSYLSNVNSKD